MIRSAKGDKSIPEYLLNFKQPINYSRKETVAAFKTGQYRLTQEERQLNKLRQAVTMNDTNKIDKILPEMGISTWWRQTQLVTMNASTKKKSLKCNPWWKNCLQTWSTRPKPKSNVSKNFTPRRSAGTKSWRRRICPNWGTKTDGRTTTCSKNIILTTSRGRWSQSQRWSLKLRRLRRMESAFSANLCSQCSRLNLQLMSQATANCQNSLLKIPKWLRSLKVPCTDRCTTLAPRAGTTNSSVNKSTPKSLKQSR